MDPFLGKATSAIEEKDLQSLIVDAVPESVHLDYKESLPLFSDGEKRELLADITSFANAAGGAILYGVSEKRDDAGKPTGLPEQLAGLDQSNADQLIRSIEDLMRSGVDERLPHIPLKAVALSGGRFVLLLRVPQSPRAPHMVILKGDRRFYRRTNGGKEPMTTSQLRDSVLQTDHIEDRIRAFVESRVGLVRARLREPFWAIHFVPLLRERNSLDVTDDAVILRLSQVPLPYYNEFKNTAGTHTLDGYKRFVTDRYADTNYWLFFRSGAVEGIDNHLIDRHQTSDPDSSVCLLHGWQLQQFVLDAYRAIHALWAERVLPLPCAVFLTLANLHFPRFLKSQTHIPLDCEPIITEEMVRPDEVLVHNLDLLPEESMRPIFNVVWNAAGHARWTGHSSKKA